MVEAKDKESDFICPFTVKKIVIPMKKYVELFVCTCIVSRKRILTVVYFLYNFFTCSQSCSHTISKQGLDAMLGKKPNAACPVAGCTAKWSRSSSSVDTDFQKRMQRFQRLQETAGPEPSQHPTTEIFDDDEDEYTQI
jgi:hypothetical protein